MIKKIRRAIINIVKTNRKLKRIIRNFNIDGIEADTLDELHDEGLLNETY